MAKAKDKGKDAQKKGKSAAKVGENSSKAKPVTGKVAPKGKDPAKVAAGKAGAPKKGERRGGRQPGTPNKRTVELREQLEAAGLTDDTHPVVMMFKVYMGEITMPAKVQKLTPEGIIDVVVDLPLDHALRVQCMKEVASYLEPKRKPVDKDGNDADKLEVRLLNLAELEPSGVGVNQG